MKKFLLILLLPTLIFASDYKSRFYAGGSISHSKISVSGNDGNEPDGSFCGNGDVHIYGGWEYHPARWLSDHNDLVRIIFLIIATHIEQMKSARTARCYWMLYHTPFHLAYTL